MWPARMHHNAYQEVRAEQQKLEQLELPASAFVVPPRRAMPAGASIVQIRGLRHRFANLLLLSFFLYVAWGGQTKTSVGVSRKSVPPAPLDAQVRVRGVDKRKLPRFSSNFELWEADSGPISGDPPIHGRVSGRAGGRAAGGRVGRTGGRAGGARGACTRRKALAAGVVWVEHDLACPDV